MDITGVPAISILDLEVIDEASARRFVDACVTEIGLGFHPDTPYEDYVFVETGERVFESRDVTRLNQLLERAFLFCDPYAIGLTAFRRDYRTKLRSLPR